MLAQAPKVKKSRKKANPGQVSSGEDDTEGERTHDEEERPRPKPRRVTRANPDATEESAGDATGDEQQPVTPKARPRARATRRKKTPEVVEAEEREESPLQSLTPSEGPVEPEEIETPKSLKRPRADEEEANGVNGAEPVDDDNDDAAAMADIQVRRKRIRH